MSKQARHTLSASLTQAEGDSTNGARKARCRQAHVKTCSSSSSSSSSSSGSGSEVVEKCGSGSDSMRTARLKCLCLETLLTQQQQKQRGEK